MSASPNSYISYYRACHQSDNRARTLQNFHSRKMEQPYWVEEFITEAGEWTVPTDWWDRVDKELKIYAREKELVGCFFFVLGKLRMGGRAQKVCAPLLFQPMSQEEEAGRKWLVPQADFYQINPAVMQLLGVNPALKDAGQYLIDNLPIGDFNPLKVKDLKQLLNKVFSNLITSELDNFPIVFSATMAKRLEKTLDTEFTIIPAAAFGLMKKSSNTRDQLNDLAELARSETFSTPLLTMLGQTTPPLPPPVLEDTYIPATLSTAQYNIIQSVINQWLTVAIGPPGTGKSFTIAATALDQISKGRSVLICSQNHQALQVVARKIAQDFGLPQIAVEAGRKDWKKHLKTHLSELLQGYGFAPKYRNVNKAMQQGAENEVRTARQHVYNWQNKLRERIAEEQSWAVILDQPDPNWWQRLQQKKLLHKIKNHTPLHQMYAELARAEARKLRSIEALIQVDYHFYLRQTLDNHHWVLKDFLKAIRSRTGTKRETYFDNIRFDIVLSALPIWLVSFADLNRVLPQTKDMFDVVIIDEASQCDMASALPALQRAKRALIVGDPKQLRHLSFLPKQRQALLAQQSHLPTEQLEDQLNYRERSLLDIALENIKGQKQVHLLNEHFRSHPQIIQFSNEQFYRSALRLMTATPNQQREESIFIKKVADGKRAKQGYNAKEGEALIFFLRLRIEDEKNRSIAQCTTIGILSPFREQVSWLQRAVEKGFSLTEIERHQLLIGTAHEFQGEERDAMFLSLALDNDAHASAFHFLNRADVFNVSITRARREIQLFISFTQSKLSRNWLITKYLDYIENQELSKVATPTSRRDAFIEEIRLLLRRHIKGRILPHYVMAGIPLDLMIWEEEKLFAIDLIAFPGEVGAALTTDQIQILGRVGVTVFPLSYSEWIVNRGGVLQEILAKV